jgi:PAS domain S-box-containing protein
MSLAALRLSPRWFACLRTLGVAVFLTLLAATGFLGLRYWQAQQAIDQSFDHSRRVIDSLDRLRANLFDLEGRRRRYLLTLDPAYLKSDGASDEGVRRDSEALQALVADDPLQSARAANLAQIVLATLGKMDEDVRTPPESGRSAALAIVVSMDEIRTQIDRMVDHQRFLHFGWRERAASLEESKTWLIAAAVVIASGFAGVALTLARREARRRRKTTEDLRRSQAYLAEAQKLTHTGSWAWDVRNQKVLYCSEEMFRIYGLDPQEPPDRENFRQRIHPAERDRAARKMDRGMREKVDSFGEYRVVRPDGTIRHVSLSGHPVVDEHGELIEWIGTAVDVTERKRTELERQRLASLVEQAADLMAIADLGGGTPVYLNEAGLKMVGFDSWEEARTRRGIHYMFPEDRQFVNEVLWPTVLEKGSWSGEMRFRHFKTGEPIPVLYTAFRIDDPETGRPLNVGNVCRDITQQKQAEAQARETDRRYHEMQTELAHANRVATMGQLTASIAHEVNQPIAAIVTNAQAALRWLHAGPGNLDEVQQALDWIVRDGIRSGEVIDRIRALIKKAPRSKDRLGINRVILEIVELTRGEAVRNSISISTDLADNLPAIEADRVQLQQVLVNLIVNAIEAMGAASEGPRELLISTGKADSGAVLVALQDSGPGLEAAMLERAFESFYTTKPTGLGMGLSICRSIIEAHGGQLWASTNQRRGATFQFTLPAEAEFSS